MKGVGKNFRETVSEQTRRVWSGFTATDGHWFPFCPFFLHFCFLLLSIQLFIQLVQISEVKVCITYYDESWGFED